MPKTAVTDRDLCAARALLRWTQNDLAAAASVPVVYIRRFERGANIKDQHLESIIDALNRAGLVFFGKASIDGGNVAGGVALKKSAKPKAPFEKRAYPPRLTKSAGDPDVSVAVGGAARQAKSSQKTNGKTGRSKPAS